MSLNEMYKSFDDIENYYSYGSSHGIIRLMLKRYVFNDLFFKRLFSNYIRMTMYGYMWNSDDNIISFDIDSRYTTLFKSEFAHALYLTIAAELPRLNDIIEKQESDKAKEVIQQLYDESYYITLFRTTYISHGSSTSCIVQL